MHAAPANNERDCYSFIVNEKTRNREQAPCSSDQGEAGAGVYSHDDGFLLLLGALHSAKEFAASRRQKETLYVAGAVYCVLRRDIWQVAYHKLKV